MPIRFRCPNCHQLLGIARRKSGTMVHCPTCNTPVLVPATDEILESPVPGSPPGSGRPEPEPPSPTPEPAAGAIEPKPPSPGGLFDRDDFDALLRASGEGFPREPAANPRPAERRNNVPSSVHPPPRPVLPEPVAAPPPLPVPEPLPRQAWQAPGPGAPLPASLSVPQVGLVLSPARATVLTVVVILLLAIAFGAGLIVGRFYLGPG
jgi:hypothetical protein